MFSKIKSIVKALDERDEECLKLDQNLNGDLVETTNPEVRHQPDTDELVKENLKNLPPAA
jgi:hypothetical protein